MRLPFLLTLALAVAAAGCADTAADTETTPARPLGLGIDTTGFDRSIRPPDDLFGFVNGAWGETVDMPADRSRSGACDMLGENSVRAVRARVQATLGCEVGVTAGAED